MNFYAQNNKGYGQPNTNTRALVLYSDISQLIVTYWNDKISMKICFNSSNVVIFVIISLYSS